MASAAGATSGPRTSSAVVDLPTRHISTREELVDEIVKRQTSEISHSDLAEAILSERDIRPILETEAGRGQIFQCVTGKPYKGVHYPISAMSLAALKGNRAAIGILLEIDPSLKDLPDKFQKNTPAHFAALAGDLELAEELATVPLKENATNGTYKDIYDLTHRTTGDCFKDIHVIGTDLLRLWIAGHCKKSWVAPIGESMHFTAAQIDSLFRGEINIDAIEVRETEKMGRGLFAKQCIPKGTPVLAYGGLFSMDYYMINEVLPTHKVSAAIKRKYKSLEDSEDKPNVFYSVDGTGGLASMINDGMPNVAITSHPVRGLPIRGVIITADKDIHPGEQLFFNYGLTHWIRFKGYEIDNYPLLRKQVGDFFLDEMRAKLGGEEEIKRDLAIHIASTPIILLTILQDRSLSNEDLLKITHSIRNELVKHVEWITPENRMYFERITHALNEVYQSLLFIQAQPVNQVEMRLRWAQICEKNFKHLLDSNFAKKGADLRIILYYGLALGMHKALVRNSETIARVATSHKAELDLDVFFRLMAAFVFVFEKEEDGMNIGLEIMGSIREVDSESKLVSFFII
ncbi:MAG: SET domain-containing protein-lysine N-methyltransferase [Simkaniaceae bacterium]|nr:SET domain-containing protein-lysine N-methyltransferase [Simkaniaceae bacterium]MCF7852758.1 SET domain-containing protein-lysine N-methyltransferase [Simkaniaceae bacterium]